MSASAENLSEQFMEVARSEADRLKLEAERLRGDAAEHMSAAEQLTAQALKLEHRGRELDELLGRAPQLRLDVPSDGLSGEQLREAAVEVLVRRHGVGEPIHYRRWFDLLVGEGHSVSGKDPLATFLTQLTRSPLVEREPGDAGVYRLDPDAAGKRALQAYKYCETALVEAEDSYRAALAAARETDGSRSDFPELADLQAKVKGARRSFAATEKALAEVARAQAALGARSSA